VERQSGLENIALDAIMSVQGCTTSARSVRVRQESGRKRVTLIEKPNVLRETAA